MTNGHGADAAHPLAALLPEYELQREVGRGAMGVVYLARHQRLDRLVAVKELQGALAADAATRDRFGVEAKALATLNHPHVVPVYDYIERDDRCVLIMEQLPGGTVWDQFVATGLTMPQATALTLATCSAMHHAHTEGILHRDIKPENLMFDADGVLKVTDFGIARMVNGASTKATVAGSVLGTPAYMAPEQAEGKNVGPSADVYATATMLYEMLSGRLPFDSADSLVGMLTQRITSDPVPVAQVAPQVPPAIAAVTMRGLERSTAARFTSAEDFGTALAASAAEAWGPAWLDASGYVVRGSERIDRAARTLRPSDPIRPDDASAGGARCTVVRGASPDSMRDGEANSTVAAEAKSESATPKPPLPDQTSTSEPAASPPVDLTPVKPKPSDRGLGRADADDIDRLIDISEVLAPPSRPIAQYAIAAVLFVAGLAWALVGGGAMTDDLAQTPETLILGVNNERIVTSDDPIEVDLGDTIAVDGLPGGGTVTLSFEQMGLPVGSTDTFEMGLGGVAVLDTGFLGNITSGALTGRVEIFDVDGAAVATAEFPATATNAWYLTAAGVISILLVLFALAGIESNLRAFRRGRGGLASFVGLAVTGALLGAASSAALTIIVGTERGLTALVGPATLCAIGAIAMGLATRASRQRRRAAKQALRHTAIKALASR